MSTEEDKSPGDLVRGMEVRPAKDTYNQVRLLTNHGNVDLRYYQVPNARSAVVLVGGVGGGWDTPARGLYPRLCRELIGAGIASIRVRYRYPTSLPESVHDVLAGLAFLQEEGIDRFALVGHSFGGAVVIQAAVLSPTTRTVVTLASQSYGAGPVSELPAGCSILLLHGTADAVLSPSNSQQIYKIAREPKRIVLYEGASHGLDGVSGEVCQTVREWLLAEMAE
ncbi:MAG: dienelactone hydrolase family protein [Dehalococcoidales bacterium]|nr:dienelactone hydrolase family protein [Dehalococcoidales bacterium]